jgi:thiamine-phosphate diphosphorylase
MIEKNISEGRQKNERIIIPGPFPILNVIIGGPLCRGKDYLELTREVLEGGARLIQLREKEGETEDLIDTAIKLQKICREYGAFFVVDDRVDLALDSGADGVHLGQEDISSTEARKILGEDKIIGVSVTGLKQAKQAVSEGASYLGLGLIYPTHSKDCKLKPGGAPLVASVAPEVNIPVFAIGGITPENTLPLLKAGASGVAVISSVLKSKSLKKQVEKFMKIFDLFNLNQNS